MVLVQWALTLRVLLLLLLLLLLLSPNRHCAPLPVGLKRPAVPGEC
jgi:hypothetical protein